MIDIISIILSLTAFIINIVTLVRLKRLDRFERFNPKKYFKGRCPYTNKKCRHFHCEDCPVEAEERRFAEEVENG